MPNAHLRQIDGLRGYLALIVVLFHSLQASGYWSLPLGISNFINGEVAVQVFIVISGFVITHLLVTRDEPYLPYITRRFFRLYPVYLLCCVLGVMAFPAWVHVSDHLPWRNQPECSEYFRYIDEIYTQHVHFLADHAIAHAVMLHGLLPSEILHRAAVTILSPAWSVSLEWQFYLIAPLIILSLRNTYSTIAMIAVFAILHFLYMHGDLGTYKHADSIDVEGSIALYSPYFALGIVSRLAWPKLQSLNFSPAAVCMALLFMLFFYAKHYEVLIIWLCFFSYLLWHANAAVSGRVFQALTASPVPLFFGRISYCVYLLHMPVQQFLMALIAPHIPATKPAFLLAHLAAAAVVIPLAWLVHHYIEGPGQSLGKYLASKLRWEHHATAAGA